MRRSTDGQPFGERQDRANLSPSERSESADSLEQLGPPPWDVESVCDREVAVAQAHGCLIQATLMRQNGATASVAERLETLGMKLSQAYQDAMKSLRSGEVQ